MDGFANVPPLVVTLLLSGRMQVRLRESKGEDEIKAGSLPPDGFASLAVLSTIPHEKGTARACEPKCSRKCDRFANVKCEWCC